MVDMEKWTQMTQEIAEKGSEPGALTSMLTQATDAFGENHAELVKANEEIESLKKANESLTKNNMELYLQVSAAKSQQYGPKEPEPTPDERATTITVKDLFKKGE